MSYKRTVHRAEDMPPAFLHELEIVITLTELKVMADDPASWLPQDSLKTQEEWWRLYRDNIEDILECSNRAETSIEPDLINELLQTENAERCLIVLETIVDFMPRHQLSQRLPGWATIHNLILAYYKLFK